MGPQVGEWTSQETFSDIISHWDHMESGGVSDRVGSGSAWDRELLAGKTFAPGAAPVQTLIPRASCTCPPSLPGSWNGPLGA